MTSEGDPKPFSSLADADALAALVIELHRKGKIDDAIVIAEHVLAIRVSQLGAEHATVADALTTLSCTTWPRSITIKTRTVAPSR